MSDYSQRAAAWVYRGIWATLVRWFRVPDRPPELPAGTANSVQSFRPSEGFLRYLKFQFWIFLLITDTFFIGLWIALSVASPLAGILITPLALAIIILPDIVAYIAIHLRYDTTWYVLSDRSLRIRRGIWLIHETTLTYNNIQNVKVNQGPLERYFGIANVMVETAGGGGGGDPHGGGMGPHVGRIEGVGNAQEIRDLVMAHCELANDSGLGDPDTSRSSNSQGHWTTQQVQLLEEIAQAAKTLPAVKSSC